jgi:hypothetical protein
MNPWRSLGGLPREVWTLFTAVLINRAGTMALPFLVLYLTQSLGFPCSAPVSSLRSMALVRSSRRRSRAG